MHYVEGLSVGKDGATNHAQSSIRPHCLDLGRIFVSPAPTHSFKSSKKMPPRPRISPRCLMLKYSSHHFLNLGW